MASFSSRGGPGLTLGVSKPDITAPGVQILAGHTPLSADPDTGPQGELFQAIAGTSMSSPHVAGAAALLEGPAPRLDARPDQVGPDDDGPHAGRRQGGRRDAGRSLRLRLRPDRPRGRELAGTHLRRDRRGLRGLPDQPDARELPEPLRAVDAGQGHGAAHGAERPRPRHALAPRRGGAPRPEDRRARAALPARGRRRDASTSRSTRAGSRSARCVTPRSSSSRGRAAAPTCRSRSSASRRR